MGQRPVKCAPLEPISCLHRASLIHRPLAFEQLLHLFRFCEVTIPPLHWKAMGPVDKSKEPAFDRPRVRSNILWDIFNGLTEDKDSYPSTSPDRETDRSNLVETPSAFRSFSRRKSLAKIVVECEPIPRKPGNFHPQSVEKSIGNCPWLDVMRAVRTENPSTLSSLQYLGTSCIGVLCVAYLTRERGLVLWRELPVATKASGWNLL